MKIKDGNCIFENGEPNEGCQPIEVNSLLPHLEKKNFIDRVLKQIVGKIDSEFVKYLLDYKSIINQEYTKLNRIKTVKNL